MRFLCLHGLGTNSDVLKAQTAPLRYALGEDKHDYDFIDGALLWPPARGIEEIFGKHTEGYSYFDGQSSASIVQAVKSLQEFVSTQGPYDGVVGFSQGAVLAATLMINAQSDRQHEEYQLPFRCAIFLCGGLPFDYPSLLEGNTRLIEPSDDNLPLIHVPVVNSWAADDTDYPGMGPPLAKLCTSRHSLEVVHNAGHSVPVGGEDLERLRAAIIDMLTCLDTK